MRRLYLHRLGKHALIVIGACCSILALAAAHPPPSRQALRTGAREIWQIGEFDHSSLEFRSSGMDYSDPKQDPVFRIGFSKDEDWPRFQPGPANGIAGGRLHPFTILFPLNGTPRGVYHLKIAILYETPRLSFLRVEVNGHAGLFYFHPTLIYDSGDWEETFVPQTSAASKIIDIPAAWLRQGENKIVLTALDDPPNVERSFGAIAPGDTGIVYDALEFTQDPDAKYDRHRVSADAVPTIFYRKAASGEREVVDVEAQFADMPREGSVELRLGEQVYRQRFQSHEEFGECRLEFDIPEWARPRGAKVTILGAGRPRTFSFQLTPAKKWTLFVIPHEHLDIGFTDYPETVAELQSRSIDEAI